MANAGFLLRWLVLSAALVAVSARGGFNITKILASHPSLSKFNHYLSETHLAAEINTHKTVTVCAVDNAAMDSLLSKNPSIYTIKNILSLHILLDYFSAKKLHQITNGTALAATLYQATGSASGSSGFVNITDIKGGKVAFRAAEINDGTLGATYVKSVEERPYDVAVIQISKIISSPEAEAPTPGPAELNLTDRMSAHGCKVFANALTADGAALEIYLSNLEGGLTVFCPGDDAFKNFLPKYKNLTADGKTSLLLFHSVPVYNSMSMLKSNNGPMNTLATNGDDKFAITVQNDGQDVTLKTKRGTVRITGTLLDEQPVAVYTLNKVLLPPELFKVGDLSPAPAPAPTEGKKKKNNKKGAKAASSPAPAEDDSEADSPSADSPDGDVADEDADGNGAPAVNVAGLAAGLLAVSLAVFII